MADKYNGAFTGAQIDEAIGKALNGTLMNAETYDPQGKATDIFKYVDEHAPSGGSGVHIGPEPPTNGETAWYDTDDKQGSFYTAKQVDELLKSKEDLDPSWLNANFVTKSRAGVSKYKNGLVVMDLTLKIVPASFSNWSLVGTLPENYLPRGGNLNFVAAWAASGKYNITPVLAQIELASGNVYLATDSSVSCGANAMLYMNVAYQSADMEVQ